MNFFYNGFTDRVESFLFLPPSEGQNKERVSGMWSNKTGRLYQTVFSAVLAVTFGLSGQLSALAEPEMLIRTVPMEVSGYAEAEGLTEKIQTADATLTLLQETEPLIVHMEALRNAYQIYGQNSEETQKLLSSLKERYMADSSNAAKFFDYGYAQLVFEGNKNGLFFLRKANDQIASPYTSLAYALAQVDVDRIHEAAAPDALTTRKMDITYKLKDALLYNKEDLLPGVWPSYVHILEALKAFPAFENLIHEDVTAILVPYGTTSANREGGNLFLNIDVSQYSDKVAGQPGTMSAKSIDVDTSCNFSTEVPNWSDLAASKSTDLDGDGQMESINFFTTSAEGPYQVRVLNHDSKVIGAFESYKAPYIMEDLDMDNRFELVVRQFDKDLYHPLYVYRWNGNCYGEDKRVSAFFK